MQDVQAVSTMCEYGSYVKRRGNTDNKRNCLYLSDEPYFPPLSLGKP